jgi:hypothetical protein
MSGNFNSDTPQRQIARKFSKNVLLEAYYNPSTIEELSLELGIAAPYMEEETEILVKAEVLKKLDNGKYETDFMILNAEAQREMENAHLKIKDEYFGLVKRLWEAEIKNKGAENTGGGYQTAEELKWLFILKTIDKLNGGILKDKYPAKGYIQRESGQWEIIAYEEYAQCPESFFIGHNGGIYGNAAFGIYVFTPDWAKGRGSYGNEQTRVIVNMLNGSADKEDDKQTVETLLDNGVFEEKDGRYIPKFAVNPEFVYPDSALYDKLKALHVKLFEEVENTVNKNIPERLREKMWFYAENYTQLRSYIISAAIKDGYIKIPEDFNKSMVAAALYVK